MPRVIKLLINALVIVSLAGVTWAGSNGVARAQVAAIQISTATYPLALDVDAAGNVWIGYKDGPDQPPQGVTVVPATSGTIFGVPVTAGVEARIFTLNSIQGIFMSPAGHLFVSTDAGALYVATETATTVFGTATTADALTPLSTDGTFSGGLGMDSQGNLFGARKASPGGGVGVMPAVTGFLYGQAVVANVPELLTPAGLPWGGWEGDLALDSADNLFVNTWFTNTGPQGVYVLPKVSGTLYGQSVTANTLVRSAPFNGVVTTAAGVDIDDSNNVYVSQWPNAIFALSPQTRFVMGQTLTANTVAQVNGSNGFVGEGIAVVPDGSSLISGAGGNTVRLTPVPDPPVLATSPVVTGIPDVGQTLSASGGTWSGDPAPSVTGFQWQRCDVTGPAGVDWLPRQSVAARWNAVTWGDEPGGGLFVAVAEFGEAMTSPDGVTWTSQTTPAPPAPSPPYNWRSVAWGDAQGGGLFVAVSQFPEAVMTSPDGVTWTVQDPPGNEFWRSITWGDAPGGGLFVAVSSTGAVMTSPDGFTWTPRTSPANNSWSAVTWGGAPGNGRFVAVSEFNDVMTSPDGITWTSHFAAANANWTSVTWGGPPGGEVFVAVSQFGPVMTSPDGVTWNSRVPDPTSWWTDVEWSAGPGGGLFVAVSWLGEVMTSEDGIQWSARVSPVARSWTSVAWGGPDGTPLFAAVSLNAGEQDVITSSPSLSCASISGATGSTYLIGDSDRGKMLRVQATATNLFGSVSAPSSGMGPVPNAVPPAPPRTPPGAPLSVVAEPTLRGAKVRWSAPADPGTDASSLYAVRSWPGGPVCQVPGTTLNCTVTGLDPELDYYFTVVPMSGAGWGAASQPSNTIRPLAPEPPGAATSVVATPGDAQAIVAWSPPAQGGSSPIREFRVVSSPAGGSCLATVPTCTVTGLVNGTPYTFTVEARNDQGWGPASQASAAVTPRAHSVAITAQRSGRLVELAGVTTGIAPGSVVTVWWRFGGQAAFAPSAAVVRVDQAGSFAWHRRINRAKTFEAYAVIEEVQSNTVLVPGRRAR